MKKSISSVNKSLLSLFIGLALIISCKEKSNTFSILNYGAKGDGKTINTKAINEAIQKCFDQGGGTVNIPAGTFVSGTIQLLSNINLHLEPGAIILGSHDTLDYLSLNSPLFNEGYSHYGLVYAKNAVNISITGQGIINGNGTSFMHELSKVNNFFSLDRNATRQGQNYMKQGVISEDGPLSYDYRPGMLLTFLHCENIHLTDINLQDAPEWTMRIGECENVAIRGITIQNNPLIPNNDGINCTSTRNVRISDCNIFTGDDAIAISGYSKEPSAQDSIGNKTGYAENVTVSNCILSSRSSCIRIGNGERLTRNMVFNNLVMYASNRGIGIYARNNSDIQDIIFSNITINTRIHTGNWWGKGEPIHISAVKDVANGNGGKIKNIRFSNITATAETGIVLYGIPESSIEDIWMDKISLKINPGKYTETFGGNFDLQPIYPSSMGIFKHDIPGMYAQYVKGLHISNFNLAWGVGLQPFFTHGIEVNHYDNLSIENSSLSPAFAQKGLEAVHISDGTGAKIK